MWPQEIDEEGTVYTDDFMDMKYYSSPTHESDDGTEVRYKYGVRLKDGGDFPFLNLPSCQPEIEFPSNNWQWLKCYDTSNDYASPYRVMLMDGEKRVWVGNMPTVNFVGCSPWSVPNIKELRLYEAWHFATFASLFPNAIELDFFMGGITKGLYEESPSAASDFCLFRSEFQMRREKFSKELQDESEKILSAIQAELDKRAEEK